MVGLHSEQTYFVISFYVYNMVIIGYVNDAIKWLIRKLRKYFELKFFGKAKLMLGVVADRDFENHTLCLKQLHQVGFKIFELKDCNPVGTLIDLGTKITEISTALDK